jgi:hypothetical protein
VELPAALRRRVVRLNAELSLGWITNGDHVWLACDLLLAGVDGPAVAELAAAPPDLTFFDGEPLIVAMLDELGLSRLDPVTAAWTIARDAAARLLDGEPAVGGRLWALLNSLHFPDDLDVIAAGLLDCDCLEASGREAELDARWTLLAQDILRAAADRLQPQH